MRNLNISPRQHLRIIIIIFLLSSSRIVVVPRTGKNMLFCAAAFVIQILILFLLFPFCSLFFKGEERVTLILLETVENIQLLSSVYVGIESKKNPICIDKLSWLNPYTATFSVPSKFSAQFFLSSFPLRCLWTKRIRVCVYRRLKMWVGLLIF